MTSLAIGAALIAGLLIAYWAGEAVGRARKESQIVRDAQEARKDADEVFRGDVPRGRKLVRRMQQLRDDGGPTV